MDLRILLFAFWSFLWAVYFMLDGFDFGVGALFTYLGRSDAERRVMINSIGPVWNGNEVWLVTAGAVTFAAFPAAYAIIFSSFYSLFGILIAALIFRGVVFDFRSRLQGSGWRKTWDVAFTLGSIMPAFLFGVVFGNLFRGLDLGASGFQGSFASFFNAYGLLTGIFFLVLFVHHGALWLGVKTNGGLEGKAVAAAGLAWYALAAIAAAFAIYTGYATRLYDNYVNHPAWFIVPATGIIALAAVKYFLLVKNHLAAFLSSSLAVVMLVFFGAVGLYPNLLPATISGTYSVTISNAAASDYALRIMAVMLIVFMPLVIGYQLWVFGVFRDRLREEEVTKDDEAY
ncbi:MAG: cytochrome d ubiquinol oxidase subunit II [Actinobacteria bacterium]|nr:cytochrome d ubiquinol oxidase subunit II [Actinomycetota bacterium]